MAYQTLRVKPEVTPGVYNSGGTFTNVRTTRSNVFPGRPDPIIHHIRDTAGSNRIVHSRSGQDSTKGKFGTLLYYEQAAALLNWAVALAGSPLKLTTLTIDHLFQMDDASGTMVYQRYLGCACNQFHLTANNQGEGILVYMDYDFTFLDTAVITVTDYPTPVMGAFPTSAEAIFEQLDGGLTIGTSRAEIKMFDLTVRNTIRTHYDAKKRPVRHKWAGRDVDFRTKVLFKALTDRTSFQALTPKTVSAAFTDGTNTITFDLQANALLSGVEDDLPMDDEASQTLTVMSRLDQTSGVDVGFTIAP